MIKNYFESIHTFEEYYKSKHCRVNDKNKFLVSFCEGKSVLDLGCIDHSAKRAELLGNSWLHKMLTLTASEVVGVDILEDEIALLNSKGFHIVNANVEHFDLNRKFDVIVAGDLIEHLSNIGLFLDNVKKHMHAESVFLISTPNPFSVGRMFKAVFDNKVEVHPQHTVWMCPLVIWEVLSRHGYKVVDFSWVDTRFNPWVTNHSFAKVLNYFIRRLRKRKPMLRSDYTMVVKLA